MGQVKGILKEEKMIYESLKKKPEYPKQEDFITSDGKLNECTYTAAILQYGIEANSDYGVWKDEKTGEILFTKQVEFIPGAYYEENGQGEQKITYEAHFPLKQGQTAEEAFKERYKLDEEKKALFQDKEKREQVIQSLSPEIQQRLQGRLKELKHQADCELNQKLNQAVQLALKQEARRQRLEKREQDPMWHVVRIAAKSMVEKNQQRQARLLIKNYLKNYDRS